MDNAITARLANEKIPKLLYHYAVPAVIGTLVNALYNIVDRIYIGQGVGALALSGLALTFPILLFLQAFGMLVGAGSSARISIHLGKKEVDKAENVLGNALMLTLILTSSSVIVSLSFLKELLIWFGGSEQTIPYAMDYLYITIPGNLLATFSFGYNAIMRASGYPRKAMVTMLIGAILNVVLDPIFIFGFGMGIRGAAIATVISMAASALFVLNHFLQKDSIVRFHRKYFKLKLPIVLAIVSIGMSPFAMQLAGSMVNVLMINALKTYGGDYAVGANGIITSFALLMMMFILGLSQGMQPIVGFNYGAGNMARVMKTLRLVILIATAVTGIGFIGSWFFPHLIVRAFTNDPLMLSISSNALRLSLMAFLVVGSQVVIAQFFQSIGMAWISMVQSISRQCLFLIPALLILPDYFGLDGVWLASPVSDVIAALTAWLFLFFQIKKIKRN